jgi:uncharacterized protein (DUF2147 family)
MQKYSLTLVLFLGSLLAQAQTKSDAILGEWLSAEKDGRIQIYKQGNTFFGKIVWGKEPRKDTNNPDASLRSRDLMGVVILKDFQFDGDDTWAGGSIYDPNNGKTYSCKMKLNNPNSLNIRGFIGISLLGRTTVWSRAK